MFVEIVFLGATISIPSWKRRDPLIGSFLYPNPEDIHASGDSTGRLIVWDVIVGQPLLTLDAVHVGGITGLTFTPDGSRLITTGLDGSVQMWGVPPE